jgi:potassium-transporting ATPase KdpC subunit
VKNFFDELRPALVAALCLLLLVSVVYPLAVWGASQLLFAKSANGSLIRIQDRIAGSERIAQDFHSARYFHPRPSAAGNGYDATSSGGSNLGPTSRKLMDTIRVRVIRYRNENGLNPNTAVPADAVMASASGLDPDISIENALMQAGRVAVVRGMDPAVLRDIVKQSVQKRDLGIFGEPRVNVLKLNLALDAMQAKGL